MSHPRNFACVLGAWRPAYCRSPTGGARSIDVTEMIQAFDWDDNELDADSYITPIDGASQGDS